MAGYKEHLTFSGACGIALGSAAYFSGSFSPAQAAIAGSLTGLAGMLPDLDSETGKPVREMSGVVAAVAPFIAVRHLIDATGSVDGTILAGGLIYVAVRYGGSWLLGKVCVHRGMFHSIPALFIAALLVFLAYKSEDVRVRILMGTGVALGFLSHLVLDEIYAVQWNGARIRLNKASGSALKCFGKNLPANAFSYGLLTFLAYAALVKVGVLATPLEVYGPHPFVDTPPRPAVIRTTATDETPAVIRTAANPRAVETRRQIDEPAMLFREQPASPPQRIPGQPVPVRTFVPASQRNVRKSVTPASSWIAAPLPETTVEESTEWFGLPPLSATQSEIRTDAKPRSGY